MVKKTHNLEDTGGTRGNDGGRINTTGTERNTKIHEGISDGKRLTIKRQTERRRWGRMIDDGTLGRIPAVPKGEGVICGKK